jgi:hypothetical protein
VASVRPAQTPFFYPTAFFTRGFWLTLAVIFLSAGCAGPAPMADKVPRSPAHLTVINQTDYEWRLVIAQVAGGVVQNMQLSARASQTVDIEEGDCVIEQTALSSNAAPELSRRVSVRFESGQTYHWRLATLLSEPNGESVSP